jgi:hypothetical protein
MEYYTTKEVCRLFRRSRETIRRWIDSLGFPEPVHHGHPRGPALFPVEEVNAWDAKHRNLRAEPTA